MIYDPFRHEPWDDRPHRTGCARVALALVATVLVFTVWACGGRELIRAAVGPAVLIAAIVLAVWGLAWTYRHPDEYSAIDERHGVDDALGGGR